jgi:hypothetical protein
LADSRPTRATVDGRAYLDLQNLARRQRRPTDELHQLYALEGFLCRLAASEYAGLFALKGGVLMAAYDARRPTRDIDLHTRALANEETAVLDVIREVAGKPLDDGLVIDTDAVRAEPIRDESDYSGVRVSLSGRLSVARIAFHVDVNVGDPVQPPPRRIVLPRILGGELTINGYPLPMIYAEKIVTMLERGTANTRWRDYADVHVLCRRHVVTGIELHESIAAVAMHRRVALQTLQSALSGFASLAQGRWAAWLRRQHLADRLPDDFAAVVDLVVRFADPILSGRATGLVWRPEQRTWG